MRLVSISKNKSSIAVAPNKLSFVDGSYPLSRFLNIYIVRSPGEKLDLPIMDFLKFVLSKDGQKIATSQGLLNLDLQTLNQELGKLN